MPEKDLESGADSVSGGVPTPTFKDNSPDSSVSNYDPKEIAKQVAEILRPDIEKTIQSTKDKRIAKLEKAVGLEELEQLGATIPENVKAEYRNRELEQRLQAIEQGSSPKTNSQGSGKVEAGEWSKVIDEVGLDLKSSDTISFLRGEYRNIDHFTAEAYKLKEKIKSQPNPTIETQPSINGHRPASENVEGLTEKYKSEMRAKVGRANASERQEIKNKYSKLGVNVHSIDFT